MWGNTLVVLMIHLFAVGVFWTWSWLGFATFCLMIYAKGCLGIAAGFHRLITHKAFQTPRWVLYVLAFMGCLALQGGPIQWASVHRLHHQESDQEKDPHSPVQKGLFWGHIGWTFWRYTHLSNYQISRHYARDIDNDRVLKWMNRNVLLIFALSHAVMITLTGLWMGPKMALSAFTWGCALSTVYVWHVTGLVNGVCHRWGYRNIDTPDNSRNNGWVALLTFGEGLHNNHHGAQSRANLAMHWLEWDATYWTIRLMGLFGLASQIRDGKSVQ